MEVAVRSAVGIERGHLQVDVLDRPLVALANRLLERDGDQHTRGRRRRVHLLVLFLVGLLAVRRRGRLIDLVWRHFTDVGKCRARDLHRQVALGHHAGQRFHQRRGRGLRPVGWRVARLFR